MNKSEIIYPCEWSYTIIGCDETALREAAQQALAGKEYSIALSNRSKAGKYLSMNITTNVKSEDERDILFKNLRENKAIKIVI